MATTAAIASNKYQNKSKDRLGDSITATSMSFGLFPIIHPALFF